MDGEAVHCSGRNDRVVAARKMGFELRSNSHVPESGHGAPGVDTLLGKELMKIAAGARENVSAIKRLAVWMIVTMVQALAFSLLIITVGHGQRPIGLTDVVIGCVAVLYVFLISGYLLTTAFIYLFMTRRNIWLAPLWGAVLFLIHFEILNHFIVPGGVATQDDRALLRLIGTCIALFTTGAGVLALKLRRT